MKALKTFHGKKRGLVCFTPWGRTGFDGEEEAENRGPRRRWPRKKRQPK